MRKNPPQLRTHDRMHQRTEDAKWQPILHLIIDDRAAMTVVAKRVAMHPPRIRAAKLFIHELLARYPALDERAPAHRNAMQPDRIIDERALRHPNGKRRADPERQLRRRDACKIFGVGKEWENIFAGYIE